MCMYIYPCSNSEKRDMNLKNEMEGYMGRFRGRKGKAEIIISKIKKTSIFMELYFHVK